MSRFSADVKYDCGGAEPESEGDLDSQLEWGLGRGEKIGEDGTWWLERILRDLDDLVVVLPGKGGKASKMKSRSRKGSADAAAAVAVAVAAAAAIAAGESLDGDLLFGELDDDDSLESFSECGEEEEAEDDDGLTPEERQAREREAQRLRREQEERDLKEEGKRRFEAWKAGKGVQGFRH